MSVNPRFYKGTPLQRAQVKSAASKTWEAGQFARSTDSGWVPVKSNGSQINGMYVATQASSTAAGDKIWVDRIVSADTLLVGCVTSGGTDTKCPSSCVGGNYGVAVNSCIATVSTGNDSTEILHIYDLLADLEGQMNDTSDVPGKVVFGVVASALTAEGSGL